MQKTICDICHAEIREVSETPFVGLWAIMELKNDQPGHRFLDLCPACKHDFRKFLRRTHDEKGEAVAFD